MALGALGSLARTAPAQQATGDWTQYQGGPAHLGSLPDGPQPPFHERWRLTAPAGESLSPPILVGDQAVTVGSEAVYGVDLVTGEVVWTVPRDGGPLSTPAAATIAGASVVLYLEGPPAEATAEADGSSPSPSASPSPSGSPATEEGAAAAAASDLVAIGLDDRQERWRVALPALARSGVTVEGSTAYVGDQDGHVVAVALEDGSIAWTAVVPGRVDTPVAVEGGSIYAVARDADASNVAIVALDAASGEERWKVFPQATSTVGSAVAATPQAVFVGSADRLMRSIAVSNGEEIWDALVLSFFSPATAPALAGDAVYAADLSGGLYRFDAADGARAWSHQLNAVVLRGAPVVSGPTVLLGLNDGRLVAIDTRTGHLVWESEETPGLLGTIALGPDVVVAVKGGRDGGLIAFEPDPDGALVDQPSPTELEPGTTLLRYGIAAGVVLALVLIPGFLLARRFGPADLSSIEPAEDEDEREEERGDGDDGEEDA